MSPSLRFSLSLFLHLLYVHSRKFLRRRIVYLTQEISYTEKSVCDAGVKRMPFGIPSITPHNGTVNEFFQMATTSYSSAETVVNARTGRNRSQFEASAVIICVVLLVARVAGRAKQCERLIRQVSVIAVITVVLCRKSILAFIDQHPRYSRLVQEATAGLIIVSLLATARTAFRKTEDVNHTDAPVPLRPMIFPCRTTHTRMFPKAHSLTYSYLFVGVPVGWSGSVGSILSSGCEEASTWFSVHQEDYLARGVHPLGLRGKLDLFLHSQEVDPVLVAGAFLITAPRFLGFSFNPVSFWYLYDSDMLLRYMILEVNNTFDERRMYLLARDSDTSLDKFTQEWKKDFHVSPFNDREGFYSLSATDPFSVPGVARVDNNIVLKTPDAKPKLVARVFSMENGVEASSFTRWQTLVFVLKWGWVGFMTNPRILREARILWVKKLQLYYRPEVNTGSIGRHETSEEVALEQYFYGSLQDLANMCQRGIVYTSAAGSKRGKEQLITIKTSEVDSQTSLQPDIQLEILTPAFYAELARKRDLWDVLNGQCFSAKAEERMACLNREGMSLLPELLAAKLELDKTMSLRRTMSSSTFRAVLNKYLRDNASVVFALLGAIGWSIGFGSRPGSTRATASRNAGTGETRTGSGTARPRFSYISKEDKDVYNYETACTTVLLAHRLALGSTTLLRFYVSVIRWLVIALLARQISKLVTEPGYAGASAWLSLSLKFIVLWLCG